MICNTVQLKLLCLFVTFVCLIVVVDNINGLVLLIFHLNVHDGSSLVDRELLTVPDPLAESTPVF